MFKVHPANISQTILVANRLTARSQFTEFGIIAESVFGTKAAGGVVGRIIYLNRRQIPYWYFITNRNLHPAAEAVPHLIAAGFQIGNNGQIQVA